MSWSMVLHKCSLWTEGRLRGKSCTVCAGQVTVSLSTLLFCFPVHFYMCYCNSLIAVKSGLNMINILSYVYV
jgi:hypothetical protein